MKDIKEIEAIVVEKLRSYTEKMGWVSVGPTNITADRYNKIDWIYSYNGRQFYVQIKIVSPHYYPYQDIRISLNEVSALRDHENLCRFQIEVCFDKEYEDLDEDAVLRKIEVLDYCLLNKIIDLIEVNPNNSMDLEFDPSEKGKLNYRKYFNKDGKVMWYVAPNDYCGYRFRKYENNFICVPVILKVDGKNICKVYDLEAKNG